MDLHQPHLREGLTTVGRTGGAGAALALAAFLAAASGLRWLYLAGGTLDLSPDEAHYWEWSRRLDLSYYSKGPLVAYLIAGLTALGGSSPLAIRSGAVLASVAGALAAYRLGREALGHPWAAALAVAGFQLTPLVWAGSLLMTIDPPFLAAWVATLWALHRALVGGSRGAWLAAGAAAGLGFLAKYAMLFVVPGLILYLWRAPEARRRLGTPALGGALVALAACLPVVVWNARHGWASGRHVVSQGRGPGWDPLSPLEFVASQLGVLTPLVGGLLAWGLWVGIREGLRRGREPCRFLAAFAVPVLAFYAMVSWQGKVQANWPAAAYPSLVLLTAGALRERRAALSRAGRRRQDAAIAAAVGLAAAVTALGHVPDRLALPAALVPWPRVQSGLFDRHGDWLYLRPRLDPTTRLRGWRELGAAVGELRRTMPAPERTFLVAERYQVTSELAFYVPGRPPAYNVNLGRRLNQYDFWDGPGSRVGWDALYVREGTGDLDPRVHQAFQRVDRPSVVEIRYRGRVLRTFSVYRAYGFRGFAAPAGPPTY